MTRFIVEVEKTHLYLLARLLHAALVDPKITPANKKIAQALIDEFALQTDEYSFNRPYLIPQSSALVVVGNSE